VSTTPRRLAALLGVTILAAILMALVVFVTYANVNGTASGLGNDSAPSIVAADHMQALAASADANALTGVVTTSSPSSYYWSQYRKDMTASYQELTTASQYTTYGFAQVGPIQTMESGLSQFDNDIGQLQAQTGATLPSNALTGHSIMSQSIFPTRQVLVRTDYSHLNQNFTGYQNAIGPLMALVWLGFLILLGVLVGTQIYLYRRTHRVINPGYLVATVITLVCMIYTLGAFNVAESQLVAAKQQSFDSINTLWSVRAVAFLMNADESLYLLDANNPKILQAVEGEFTTYQQGIVANLDEQLKHISYPGERSAVRAAIQTFANYVAIDSKVRQDLASGNVPGAQTLVLGFSPNPLQAALAFTQFDSAMWNAIDINQFQFDQQMNNVFASLGPVPYILGITLLVIIVATIVGMKPRLDEYAV
jgi:hypothetical protein